MADFKKVDVYQVEAAVKFWSDFLRDPNSFIMDNGESSQFMMLNILAKLGGPANFDEKEIESFEYILTKYIYDDLADGKSVSLRVDYQPEGNLAKALDITFGKYNQMTIFPCKTSMWIRHNCVQVAQGYAAPTQTIYAAEINTDKLEDGKSYTVFTSPHKIFIGGKIYRFEFVGTDNIGVDSDGDTITIEKDETNPDKFIAVNQSRTLRAEIKVFEYLGDVI